VAAVAVRAELAKVSRRVARVAKVAKDPKEALAARVRVMAAAKVTVKAAHKVAASKVAAPVRVQVMDPKVVASRAVAVAWEAEPAAEAAPIRYRPTYLTEAMTTSLRVSFEKPQCRRKILSCARNYGRSTAITRRAPAEREPKLVL